MEGNKFIALFNYSRASHVRGSHGSTTALQSEHVTIPVEQFIFSKKSEKKTGVPGGGRRGEEDGGKKWTGHVTRFYQSFSRAQSHWQRSFASVSGESTNFQGGGNSRFDWIGFVRSGATSIDLFHLERWQDLHFDSGRAINWVNKETGWLIDIHFEPRLCPVLTFPIYQSFIFIRRGEMRATEVREPRGIIEECEPWASLSQHKYFSAGPPRTG